MEQVTVLQWLKAVGDRVASGEALVVLETDKANVEVDSPATGRLTSILIPEGTAVMPGQVLAEIEPE
jgi:pyruvate/2-oxoglutarate dehydrogenase complex dihydrolipoamide acyltransferase (E2) component